LSVSNNPEDEGTILAHNLAQYVHCSAQGKIGSGFDVSAAVFGSQVYTRFNDAVLKPLMDHSYRAQPSELLAVLGPGNKAWTSQVVRFVLPPLTRLMLADVDAGSDTPSLVGNVLKWRNADREAGGVGFVKHSPLKLILPSGQALE
jgi:phosphomevalonate kinase